MVLYTVQPGDTLYTITRRFGVSLQRVIMDNGLADPNRLAVGQCLLLLSPALTYTVQPGDSLSSIAAHFGVTPMTLLQNNPRLALSPRPTVGQELVIHFTAGKRRQVAVNGYAYDSINQQVLRRALPFLTYLTIFDYGFTLEGGLAAPNDLPLIALAKEYQALPVMLLSSLTEEGSFSAQKASQLFRDQALQSRVLNNVLSTMIEKGYVGLDIDMEFIQAQDAETYLAFLERAAQLLHQHGYFLHVDLPPKASALQGGPLYEAYDYQAIGQVADSVLLMTYEWGYTYGPPMAIAPIDQVRPVVEYGTKTMDRRKILMGLPNYAYDWILPFERGATRATAIGNEYAVEIAQRQGAEIQYDETAQSPWFMYTRDGLKHVVWFEDVRSIEKKYGLMDEFALRGGSYWNLMRPFQQNWSFLAARYAIEKKKAPAGS
ncbi:LysM peptidoglycan-binding domain-containing protein [Acutalibacter intestini]|uniref:LysM peptidoglycan-binding domain-containing protein n=1 Tax=Acutalibacter intestini TaxID=3093659 RepID=UPI002AC8DF51|nr:LysM peptidoglycan-binding domain-containing protein [Acutalibacter sp. M00204]